MIENLIEKLAIIGGLGLTEEELAAIEGKGSCIGDRETNFIPSGKEMLNIIEYCKFANVGNAGKMNNVWFSENGKGDNTISVINTDKPVNINYPHYFVCVGSGLCRKDLEDFQNCRRQNNDLAKCYPILKSLESCMEYKIDNFIDSLI